MKQNNNKNRLAVICNADNSLCVVGSIDEAEKYPKRSRTYSHYTYDTHYINRYAHDVCAIVAPNRSEKKEEEEE